MTETLNEIKIVTSKDNGIISIQVWTNKLPGRPFPAWAVLVDITEDGKILSEYTGAEEHRKEVIASYKEAHNG